VQLFCVHKGNYNINELEPSHGYTSHGYVYRKYFNCFNSTFIECIWKKHGIHSIVNTLQELDNVMNEFDCQEACQKWENCQLFYWKENASKCYLFSNLLEGKKSIVNETSSVIGQPDCQNLKPDWPKSLYQSEPLTQTRFDKCYLYLYLYLSI